MIPAEYSGFFVVKKGNNSPVARYSLKTLEKLQTYDNAASTSEAALRAKPGKNQAKGYVLYNPEIGCLTGLAAPKANQGPKRKCQSARARQSHTTSLKHLAR
jgi:hypothetical protein